MRNELKIELQRAFCGPGFICALMIGIVIAILQFIQFSLPWISVIEPLRGEYPLSVFSKWMGGENASLYGTLYYFLSPVLVAIPYAGSFKTDIMEGYFTNIVTRTDSEKYLAAKGSAVFLSGAVIGTLPLIINFLLTAFFYPCLIPQSSTSLFPIYNMDLMDNLYYTHPFVYIGIYLLIDFIFFGLIATLSLSYSYFSKTVFDTIMFPFIVSLILFAVSQMMNHLELCPFAFLRPSQPVPANLIIICVESVVMLVALFFYYILGKRRSLGL